MNRREWIKSSGTLLAGFTALSTGFLHRQNSPQKIPRPPGEGRKFIRDDEFMASLSTQEIKARLSANENPFGPSEKAKAALRQSIDGSFRYGWKEMKQLSANIAEKEGVDQEQVMMAAGSSPILLAAAIHFSREGGNIITGDPSYADLPSTAEQMGSEVRWIPLSDDFSLDLEQMEAAVDSDTRLVYICNPNNPTATISDPDELRSFCKRVSKKVPVFIDEAYIEYLDQADANSMMGLVAEGYNVIIARTFSKMYGFAGLRVGYMVAQTEMVSAIGVYTRRGMSVSATSAAAALATYEDAEFILETREKTEVSKAELISVLEGEGYSHIPSFTNFVMFPVRLPGPRFIDEMARRGVSIRSWTFAGQDWCRVTVGTQQDIKLFANAFRQIS